MGELLNMLAEPLWEKMFDGIDDGGVKHVAARVRDTRVHDFLGERVLECVLCLGKEARLTEELRCLKYPKMPTQIFCRHGGDCVDEDQRRVSTDHSGTLDHLLFFRIEAVDPRGEYCLDR